MNSDWERILIEAATAPTLAVDTEGTEIKNKKNNYEGTDYRDGTGFAYGISIAYRYDGEVKSYYFPIKHERDNVPDEVFKQLQILIRNHPRIVCHHMQHDIVALETLGIEVRGNFYCTMLMVHWIDENQINKGLEAIALKLLGEGKERSPEFEACLTIFGWTPAFPSEVMSKYAAVDADRTLRCFELILPEFVRQGFDG